MKNSVVIKKFGGTSVGSLEKIEKIADRLKKDHDRKQRPVVVVSAMSGDTNKLIKMAEEIYPNYRGSSYDMLLASGEQVSISLLAMALERRGIGSHPLLSFQAGIQTDSLFSKANIQSVDPKMIREILDKNCIPLVAGFQGITKQQQITTLGRGGSDLTAVALAVSLGEDSCEIYTDVDGVFTGDPRIIPDVKKIEEIGFSEMMEMSSLGSKVLQIRCVELAAKHNVKINVRHAFNEGEGTWIVNKENSMEGSIVSAVAHDDNTLVIRINKVPGDGLSFTADLFKKLGDASVYVDIISQSQSGDGGAMLSFSIPKTDLDRCLTILKSIIDEDQIEVIDKISKISIIGVGMAHHSGVAGRFFSVFEKIKLPLYLVTTSEIKISAIIDSSRLSEAAKALHFEFNLQG